MSYLSSPKSTTPLLSTLASAALLSFLTGCAMQSTAPSSLQLATAVPALKGGVMGGQQPVFGSVIGLYAAGTSGYGTGATNLVTGTVKTDANGAFTITNTLACPSASTPTYLTATGGDPSGAASSSINNTAIELVAALGPCGNLTSSTYIQVNEVTTAAAAFGLGQFFSGFGTSTDAIGAPSTNQNGLINAFATANNLASFSTGVATPTTAASGTNYSLIALDQRKLNTIANILSDCVNQTASSAIPCTTLFSAATPTYAPRSTSTAATAPTDIFQAAVYMSLNPTSTNASSSSTNMTSLIALQTPFMPFAPALTTAPTDWTLAIQYTGTGISYLSSAAVDANGDLWFSNTNTTGGVVMLNGGTGTIGGTAGVTGGVINFFTGISGETANGTRQVAIDKEGNAWYGGYNTAYLYRTTASTSSTLGYSIASGSTLPYAISIDGNDEVVATTANGNILEIAATATTGSPTTTAAIVSASSSASLAITSGTTPTAYAPTKGGSGVYEFTTTGTPVTTFSNTSDGETANYGAAVDGNNKAWIANESTAGALSVGSGSSFTQITNTCLLTPQFVAIDGNNNVWVSNSGTVIATENGASDTFNTVCEFNNAGTLISSSIGYGPHGISTGRGIAVDLSGNVWVTSYGSTYSTVTEIVGAAVPAVAPLSKALFNGTVGTRP